MLSREELRLLNEILGELNLDGEKKKLQTKLSLIVKQLNIMEKAQEETAKVQEEIVALDGDENEKKEK